MIHIYFSSVKGFRSCHVCIAEGKLRMHDFSDLVRSLIKRFLRPTGQIKNLPAKRRCPAPEILDKI
jgi:hypothetical protein